MEKSIDFEGLSSFLLARIRDVLTTWLPGGRMVGHEYTCGDLRGGQGDSCRVNIDTGRWADFAADVKGGDLISLYAAIQGIKQGEAAKQLIEQYNYSHDLPKPNVPREIPPQAQHQHVIRVPDDAPEPKFWHPEYGKAVSHWCYRDQAGKRLFYIARFNKIGGKEFLPYSWNGAKWIPKSVPAPRPLYGLDLLAKSKPDAPILIVEGEKAADAARTLTGIYAVISWPGGSKAITKVDWSPIYGRKILIWPDADKPGVTAAQHIAAHLSAHCPEIKVISVSMVPGLRDGWDVADAVAEGWDKKRFYEWAKPLAVVVNANTATINIQQNNITIQSDEETAVPSESMYALWNRLGLALSTTGHPINNEDNVARIFEGTPNLGSKLWFDDFYNSVFLDDANGGHPVLDLDIFKLTMFLQRSYGLSRINDSTVRRALLILADRVHKNEPMDWMESLVWDNIPRIDQFFNTHLGAAQNPYVMSASKNFWMSMAARIYRPGCIMRTMVILKSKQWAGKSTAFSIIGGKWYAEALESIQSNNFLQSLHGKMLIEFGDMSGMDRAEINRIKQVISCRMDRFRAPYDMAPKDHPRRSVLVATTNEGNFLRDDTGGSRFWPIETGVINHDKIIADRSQLFAEAVARFKNDEAWHIMPMEETEAVQESYRQTDEWENIIAEYLENPSLFDSEITVTKIATECLKMPVDKLDKSTQIRIARNLSIIGWEKHQKWENGKNVKVWKKIPKIKNSEPEIS